MAQILLVQRTTDERSFLRLGLRMVGHTIFEASTGSSAVAMVQTEPVDVLVMDDNLPDMSGTETLLRIRSIPTLERLPAVILWPRPNPDEIVLETRRTRTAFHAPALEGVYGLRKPVSTHDVNLAIQHALSRTDSPQPRTIKLESDGHPDVLNGIAALQDFAREHTEEPKRGH